MIVPLLATSSACAIDTSLSELLGDRSTRIEHEEVEMG